MSRWLRAWSYSDAATGAFVGFCVGFVVGVLAAWWALL